MKNKRKESIEKGMLVLTLVIIGCFLCIPVERKRREEQVPVFRPVQRKENTEETQERTEEAADGGNEKKREVTVDCWKEPAQEEWGDRTNGWLDDGMAVEEQASGKAVEPVPTYGERDGGLNILKVEREFVKKAEKRVENPADFPSALWTEEDTKTPVCLFYAGGLKELYCVGADDLRPEECLVYVYYSDGSRSQISPLMFRTEGFSAEKPGFFQGKISFQGMSVTVPYEVAEFQVVIHPNGGACIGNRETICPLYDYTLESLEQPQRTGYFFAGWYLEEELATAVELPMRVSERVTHLYAGWRKYESSYTLEDGILVLAEGCTAIGEWEFRDAAGEVEEIYVGAGVSSIAPGAFRGLDRLEYIDVDWKNPYYTTINCSLYTKDGKRLTAYPGGLKGTCRVYAGTEILGKYVFYESRISALILPESLKGIEGFAFGKYLEVLRFQGMTPPEFLSREAFAGVSEDIVIEVPETALESYREALGKISPALEGRVIGFQKE